MKQSLRTKTLLLVALVINSIGSAPQANAGVTDCIDVGYPSSYLGTSSLTIEAYVNVRCTNEKLGSGSGFVYSVEGESFGAQCSGPNYVRSGSSGTIRCSIPIGGGLGSTRYGATSTTIKIWTAWDFSTKFITATHQAIPNKIISVPTPVAPSTPTLAPKATPNTPTNPNNSKSDQDAINEMNALLEKVNSDIEKLQSFLEPKYKLTCKKAEKLKYVTGSKPKCPSGFKQIKKITLE
jgi:hypothetical protein